jgi:hypothetical protein
MALVSAHHNWHAGFDVDQDNCEISDVPIDNHTARLVLESTAAKSMADLECLEVRALKLFHEEPAVLRKNSTLANSSTQPCLTTIEEDDIQPTRMDSRLNCEGPRSVEIVATSAAEVAARAREQIMDLEKFLEERRAANESQRIVAEGARALCVRAAFPSTPRCVNMPRRSRGRGTLIEAC